MNANSMTCDVFADRLMAYLEDETDARTRAALERHAATCAECGAVLADLRQLRLDAANLPELAPSRDLWAGVAARIEAPVVPIGAPAVEPRRAPAARFWKIGLVAASLVGAAALGYLAGNRGTETPRIVSRIGTDTILAQAPETVVVTRETEAGPLPGAAVVASTAPATTAPTATAPVRSSTQLVVASLTADYDREIRQLTQLLETRRNQLDPVTVAIIERNLQVIDTAITEAQQAIARDPASRFLIESLNQSLQMKVELMRTAAMLPSRI